MTGLSFRLPGYVPQTGPWAFDPHANPRQQAFLALNTLDGLYGGAAGGGKTDALLAAAMQWVDVPRYSAILFRRTSPQLHTAGGLVERSKLWLSDTDATWNESKLRWTFPSGARLSFGHMQHPQDMHRWAGPEFQFIGVDELTEFDEAPIRFLFSRLRRPKEGPLANVPLRFRGATNPTGKGRRWVKRRYVDRPRTRPFIPATARDNPMLDQETYLGALRELEPELQAALIEGRWDVREPGPWAFNEQHVSAAEALGAYYDQLLLRGQMPPPVNGLLVEGVDYGDFRTHAVVLWPLERGGLYVAPPDYERFMAAPTSDPHELESSREDPEDIALAMLDAARAYPYHLSKVYYDASFAQTNRTVIRTMAAAVGVRSHDGRSGAPKGVPIPFGEYKTLSVKYIRHLAKRTYQRRPSRVLAISPRNRIMLDQMLGYQEDDEKFIKGDDDAVDALIAGAAPSAWKHRALLDAEVERAKTAARRAVAA